MTISQSHYHHNRLLRDRIRKNEQHHWHHSPPADSEARTDDDETFILPDYFNQVAKSPNQDEQPTVVVILWDEVTRTRRSIH